MTQLFVHEDVMTSQYNISNDYKYREPVITTRSSSKISKPYLQAAAVDASATKIPLSTQTAALLAM